MSNVGISQSVYRPSETTDAELEREFEARYQYYAARRATLEKPGIRPILCGWVLAFGAFEIAAIAASIHWYPQICAAWDWFWRGM